MSMDIIRLGYGVLYAHIILHYEKHKFHDYIEKTRIAYNTKYIEEMEYGPKSIAIEKDKEIQREIIYKYLEI
jgi:hypothetical protein